MLTSSPFLYALLFPDRGKWTEVACHSGVVCSVSKFQVSPGWGLGARGFQAKAESGPASGVGIVGMLRPGVPQTDFSQPLCEA